MEKQLLALYGPLLGGTALHQALGFPTAAALLQSELRGQVGVALFRIPNRRGRFAMTAQVAAWLANLTATLPQENSTGNAGAEAAPPASSDSPSDQIGAAAQR